MVLDAVFDPFMTKNEVKSTPFIMLTPPSPHPPIYRQNPSKKMFIPFTTWIVVLAMLVFLRLKQVESFYRNV